ncbi:Bug family tripartite tricarboxylate transporter substrate binding protein [Bordetella holmesii]|uniref:Bug family tripartite tricarboxylate transporter substrate binding protein n=1 Tax=Bordetella holmesii TaxID=35814 RepID=UPI002E77D370|nr:tripartite tricarboxylate transporter substrate-binding protein [Bordetella holmesii]
MAVRHGHGSAGGQIQVGITGLPAVQAYAKSGKLRIIGLTTGERFASAPDYSTVAEQGFPGFSAPPWSGFFAPKGTPKALVEKISADMREVMTDPAAKEKMIAAGSEFTLRLRSSSRPSSIRKSPSGPRPSRSRAHAWIDGSCLRCGVRVPRRSPLMSRCFPARPFGLALFRPAFSSKPAPRSWAVQCP